MSDNIVNLADWKDNLAPVPLDPRAKLPAHWVKRLADIETEMIAETARRDGIGSVGH